MTRDQRFQVHTRLPQHGYAESPMPSAVFIALLDVRQQLGMLHATQQGMHRELRHLGQRVTKMEKAERGAVPYLNIAAATLTILAGLVGLIKPDVALKFLLGLLGASH